MKSKRLFLLATLSLSLGILPASGEVRIGYGPASQLARASDIPGKNVPGQCLQFARALHARFQAAGIPSKIITYGYEPGAMPVAGMCPSPPAAPLSHAVVVYNDGGRTYIMDNQSWAPVWVPDATRVGMMQRFSGLNVAVRDAWAASDATSPMMAASGNIHPARAKRDRGSLRGKGGYITAR